MTVALLIATIAAYSILWFIWMSGRTLRALLREYRNEQERIRVQLYAMSRDNAAAQSAQLEKILEAFAAKSLNELHVTQVQKERARAEIEIWKKSADVELENRQNEPKRPVTARGVAQNGEEVEIDLASGDWVPM